MPITQNRMIALINAGFDYKQGLDSLLSLIAQQRAHLDAGQITPQDFLNILLPSAKIAFLLNDPVQSAITLISEEKHFRREAKRNVNKAKKVRENKAAERQGRPRPQRSTTAPPRIDLAHGQRPNLLTASQQDGDPQFGENLELGDFGSPEVVLPPDYIPGQLNQEQKDSIAAFSEEQAGASQFIPLPGFTLAQSICLHFEQKGNSKCEHCGKELSDGGR